MTWTLHRWVWRLTAPLFIGMPPAGALNRCRLYVPARAFWGAVTAEISRSSNGSGFPDYDRIGKEIALDCRFTYLYPTEKINGDYLAWLPKYEEKEGLRWHRQDGQKICSDRDFRRLLLSSRPGTAIAPETDSALEGSLRYTECINPWWRDASGRQAGTNSVFLLGYVFLNNNNFSEQLKNLDTLLVGGDTRYGLGRIKIEEPCKDLTADPSVFGCPACLEDNESPGIKSDFVWGHARAENEASTPEEKGIKMQGRQELLGGWDYGAPWKGKLTWAPGSFLESPELWSVDSNGYWIHPAATTHAATMAT